ncbi:hypothetical protein [Tessaracoccus antarcticus]|nr:hypothetical protein [Tessaracoccus antarcticus]
MVAIYILARHRIRSVALLLVVSLVIRVGLVFWDLNLSHIVSLPNSGLDSEMFFNYARAVAQDPSLLSVDIRGGAFSKLFGTLFWVTGPLRIFGQYTNVLFGMSLVLVVGLITDLLPLDREQTVKVMAVVALLPNSLILSSIFLRESVVGFLVASSAYFFARWFQSGRGTFLIWTAVMVLVGATFHAAVIAVGIGYVCVSIVYQPTRRCFGVSLQGLAYLAIAAAMVLAVVAKNPDVFLGKFDGYGSEEILFGDVNRRSGGSQYLSGLTISSYPELLLFGPLRAVYFLGAPMPWDIRGLVDAATFLSDSVLYLGAPFLFLRRRKLLGRNERLLGYALMISIVISSIVFGAGVSNAGTAARHRFKLAGLFFALIALSKTSNSDPAAPSLKQVSSSLRKPAPLSRSTATLRISERGVAVQSLEVTSLRKSRR